MHSTQELCCVCRRQIAATPVPTLPDDETVCDDATSTVSSTDEPRHGCLHRTRPSFRHRDLAKPTGSDKPPPCISSQRTALSKAKVSPTQPVSSSEVDSADSMSASHSDSDNTCSISSGQTKQMLQPLKGAGLLDPGHVAKQKQQLLESRYMSWQSALPLAAPNLAVPGSHGSATLELAAPDSDLLQLALTQDLSHQSSVYSDTPLPPDTSAAKPAWHDADISSCTAGEYALLVQDSPGMAVAPAKLCSGLSRVRSTPDTASAAALAVTAAFGMDYAQFQTQLDTLQQSGQDCTAQSWGTSQQPSLGCMQPVIIAAESRAAATCGQPDALSAQHIRQRYPELFRQHPSSVAASVHPAVLSPEASMAPVTHSASTAHTHSSQAAFVEHSVPVQLSAPAAANMSTPTEPSAQMLQHSAVSLMPSSDHSDQHTQASGWPTSFNAACTLSDQGDIDTTAWQDAVAELRGEYTSEQPGEAPEIRGELSVTGLVQTDKGSTEDSGHDKLQQGGGEGQVPVAPASANHRLLPRATSRKTAARKCSPLQSLLLSTPAAHAARGPSSASDMQGKLVYHVLFSARGPTSLPLLVHLYRCSQSPHTQSCVPDMHVVVTSDCFGFAWFCCSPCLPCKACTS